MLKVYQLASFTPLVEENYDKEIEHYEYVFSLLILSPFFFITTFFLISENN